MTINITKKLFIELGTEWTQLLGKYNWLSFTPIHIYFEIDNTHKGNEFWFTLLGFSMMIRYNTDEALEIFDKYDTELADLMK